MQPYAKKVALGSAIALSAGGGYLALNKRRPILMEAYLKREKLPIYPAPQPEIVLVETSSDLESHIAVAREQTTSVFRSVRDETQKVVSMWINIERRAAAHVKRVVPDDEPLTPGIAWVGVSTLAGSLVARNRTFLLRMIAPPAFFLISLPYFLPKLAANLSREVSTTTAVRAPEFHGQAAALKHQLDDTFEHAEDWFQDTRESVAGTVGKTVSFVERKTGLQLYQAFESSFSRRPEVGHHGHETEHSAPAHERVAISAKPVDHATVPLFMQTPTTASTLPGTPIPAPGTTTAGSPVQTLDVPIYRRVGGPASTTEQLDAAAARVLSKVEDKVADGVRAAKASDAGQAAANAADQAKADVGSGLSSLKRKAENALHSADHNAARAVGATTDAVEAGERKLGQTVDAGKRKAGEAVDAAKASAKVAASEAQAEANRVVSGLSQGSLARTAGDKAQVAASEAKAEAGRVFRGLDNGADARTLASGAGDKAKSAAREAQAEASYVARGLDNGGSLAQTAGDKAKTAANEAQAEAGRIIRGLDGGVDTRSLPQTAGDKAKALAHEAQEKATSAARAVRSKTTEFADSAQDKAASTASTARSEAAQLSNEGSRAAHHAEDATAEAARSARQQAERAASATRAEASHLSHEASLLASAAQAKGSQLAHDAQQAASSAARTVESKAAELGREGKALFQAGEDKARSALVSAEGKANRAASAVESSLDHAKAEAKDGLERVKSEAADAKRAATNADKRLKVDEQTVDGKRQEQPPVVGLLAGRERETGYKKLV